MSRHVAMTPRRSGFVKPGRPFSLHPRQTVDDKRGDGCLYGRAYACEWRRASTIYFAPLVS
jgi:hypothetical protein